ncbi:MAG TPA: EutN/CcmL family microcompartment protein [Candidatus Sumerlaeota bacterium]|nr:EutN/CcmL family microcompartment protein [Candidatus Sumerlaeota bacterium]HMX62445.1 EutN/CcmL family microcompartment protein [Candidatus Sumerlaeota bacterium]HMZ51055.1 EutN/CcmL family microcompartment protein [Candidatus Sumerlaeota bacterium]HNM45938.1 EutN/CcmL family microcompartment protein [Candidatus Sumerlaeota bacterium]
MKIGRVIGNVVSVHQLEAYEGRKLLMVQPVNPDGKNVGRATMAIDYVGAGMGDLVIMSAAPGLASTVFKIERAPINEMISGIIDKVDVPK